ncbi:MAG: glycosyltransferase [Cyclobacteriaceae bacterium]
MTIKARCVLVTPLNWGLGHATRCIPVIQTLLELGHRVIIASDGDALALLRREFPELKSFELPGYQPHYPSGSSMVFSMALQLPKFYAAIRKEHKQVTRLIAEEGIDAVISDNRYGAWSDVVPCAVIIHQLNLIMPRGFKWIESLVNIFHRMLIKKFNRVWVPDMEDSMVSGRLSAGVKDSRIRFMGPLSRFKVQSKQTSSYDLVAVLSGPEPQRSVFERALRDQLPLCGLKCLLVRGIVNNSQPVNKQGITVVDFLSSEALNAVLNQASVVVARSGYSTLMDMLALGKKAILVPTPGQTEQEYLGERAMERRYAYTVNQHDVRVMDALSRLKGYTGFPVVQFQSKKVIHVINELMRLPLPVVVGIFIFSRYLIYELLG